MEQDFISKAFSDMQENGWDINGPLIWGFFFISENKENLAKIFNELKDHNYKIEEIRECDGKWRLWVSKVEVLTEDKLRRRKEAFNELAAYYNSEFDGWDVGRE